MYLTEQTVLGLPEPYRKTTAVMEVYRPLTELAVDYPHLLKEAGQNYLAEKGTVFSMHEVTDVEFYRNKINGRIHTGISLNVSGEVFTVPKITVKRFITRLFGPKAYATLSNMPAYTRDICLEAMFDENNKDYQLLHNYNNEVLGIASPAYTFINTLDTAIIAEEMLRAHFPKAEYKYIFSKQYGFRGFIYAKQREELQSVGDVRKMFFLKNQHSGCDAFRIIPGLERLACTNGMTSKENYPGVRLVHLDDDSEILSEKVRQELLQQVEAINSMYKDLECSTTITVPYERAELFLSRLPKLPKKFKNYITREIKERVKNDRIKLYDIQYVLSYVASNLLDKKPQWQTYREKTMNLAGNSIDPDLFDNIVKEQQEKEDAKGKKDEFHDVEVQ